MSLDFIDNYARIRKLFNTPKVMPPLAIPAPVIETIQREFGEGYINPIGPVLPNDRRFPFYNGQRDVLYIESGKPVYKIMVEDIMFFMAKNAGMTRIQLIAQRRTPDVVRVRQQAMWLAKTYTARSLPEIGRLFGGRDHTTVLHSVRKIDKLIADGGWIPPSAQEIAAFAMGGNVR